MHDFKTIRQAELERNNKIGRLEGSQLSDVHLLFPCSYEKASIMEEIAISEAKELKSVKQLFHVGEDAKADCAFFLEKLKEYNNSEMTGTFTRKICRKDMGYYSFVISYGEANYEIEGILYLSRHQLSDVGMVSVIFPFSSIPASLILTALCGSVIKIKENQSVLSFEEWTRQHAIQLEGSPKAVVFEYGKTSTRDIINCLACEYEPMAEINGDIFTNWSEENFAQYSVAKVHASDVCLYYEMSQNIENILERLNQEAVEIFFVELLVMQEAAVNRVCNRVYDYLNERFSMTKKNANESLFELSREAANAILFVDYKELRYPTVRSSAKRIAERFGFHEDMEKYYKCREVLEQMISIDSVESEAIENKLMNLLLLILTMLQVLPTFSQVAAMVLKGEIEWTGIASGGAGALGCIILYTIYRICYRRARRKSKERLYGKMKR